MRHSIAEQAVTLWFEGGCPERLVWAGERWRVIDRPTPLSIPRPTLVRSGAADVGWRLTAKCESTKESRVFDLVYDGSEWHIARSYD